MRWGGHVARVVKLRNAYEILAGRSEGEKQLGSPRCRWEDNIKIYLGEIVLEEMDWVYLAQDRDQCQAFVNTVMNFRAL
jgi:hypothetical protein